MSYTGSVVGADRYSSENCSLARALEVVGEKWSLLIVREAIYGSSRFEDFHRRLGCARNLLAQRLETLVRYGVLEREVYEKTGLRTRYEYRLSDKGHKLYPAFVALLQWGDEYFADPAGPPAELRHRGCRGEVKTALVCEHGHVVSYEDTVVLPGPGAIEIETT